MLDKWQKMYDEKLITFDQFPDLVQDGDEWCNAMGTTAGSANFHQAMIDRYKEFKNVRYSDEVQVKPIPFFNNDLLREMDGHINYHGWYWLPAIGKFTKNTVADYSSIMTEDCTRAISRVTNVFTVMVAKPNEQGYFNCGLNNFFSKGLIQQGRETGALREVVVEVNDQMPYVYGDNWIHISEIDHIIENSTPIPAFGHPVPDETDRKIGDYCLELIRNGDCIQMGLGGLTEPVIERLDNFRDLGTNSEMVIMGLPALAETGAINNLNKKNHKGVSTATLIMGDQRLYDYCTENPAVNLFMCDYINHPQLIAENPQVLAINQALMVDTGGQICAESAGFRQISGPGGQLDFSIGAHWSEGGRSIVLMRSAQIKDGKVISNIRTTVPGGTIVTVPRAYADFVITEYGIASLRGKSRRARAKELIAIAHPDCREQLKREAQEAFYTEDWRDDAHWDFNWDQKQKGFPSEWWINEGLKPLQ